MRLSVMLFLLSLLGSLFGAWLVGRWCIGVVVLAYSLGLGVLALLRDDGKNAGQPVMPLMDTGLEEDRFRRRVAAEHARRTG